MITSILFLILSIISSFIFVILLFTSSEFNQYIEAIDEKDFPLKDIYGVGFRVIKLLKIQFRSRQAVLLKQEVSILYGEKYAEYYLRVLYAQKISFSLLCFVFTCIFACITSSSDRVLMFGLGLVLTCTIYYYFSTTSSKKIEKRSLKFMNEFPNAVSTVALLVNSGMILREAWNEVAMSDDTELYMEMRKVNEDINNGVSEIDALHAFANRCVTPEIKKFTSFIIQGLEKGSKDLSAALKSQTEELWEEKKQNVLQQGELASSKLLIPIMIMFIGILIMVMGPIMTNIAV